VHAQFFAKGDITMSHSTTAARPWYESMPFNPSIDTVIPVELTDFQLANLERCQEKYARNRQRWEQRQREKQLRPVPVFFRHPQRELEVTYED
jgi:hypothetical protein